MQEYIDNPLLLDVLFIIKYQNRKFDIRLHIVVASYHPFILYLHRKLYIMKCSYTFDHGEFKNQTHICSAGY